MEELLNGIDRLLGNPELRNRLLADAEELHQLLTESRGLFPKGLPIEDQPSFNQAIDDAAASSKKLFESIQANDRATAREVIAQLFRQREEAHKEYSN